MRYTSIGLVAVSTGLIASFVFYAFQPLRLLNPQEHAKIEFQIIKGMGFSEIAAKLEEERLIRSAQAFKIYSVLTGNAQKLKAGTYTFNFGVSLFEVVKTLVMGPPDIQVSVSPGLTLKEIDDKLSSLAIINKGELINFDISSLKGRYAWLKDATSLEGLLLPDTYYFSSDSDSRAVVWKFFDNFEAKVLPILKNNDTLMRIITLASILEKEIPDYNEQRIAAGISEKRLAIGMPLQADATLFYMKCSGRYLGCSGITKSDYKIDSPYNSYLYATLPPTPISNPSLDTIRAASNPVKTDYWFYLSDPKTKKTIFSKNLDEHNTNRVKYLLN